MKKVFLALVLIFALALSASAAFVSSPSAYTAPELISGENVDEECEAGLVITPFAEAETLPEELQDLLDEAYDIIKNTPDLSVLNAKLAELASARGIDTKDLAVTELFDIHATDCTTGHEDHGHFDIVLKPEFLSNFVCLLHYYKGEWRIVENAEVTNNGTHLEFDEDEFSPFAIVVDTTIETPKTGDSANPVLWAAIMVASLALIVFIVAKSKKKA